MESAEPLEYKSLMWAQEPIVLESHGLFRKSHEKIVTSETTITKEKTTKKKSKKKMKEM